MNSKRIQEIFIGLIIIVSFFLLSVYRNDLINHLTNYDLSNFVINLISGLSMMAIIAFCMLLLKPMLVKNWHDLQKNHHQYFRKYLPYWLIALGIMMVSNLILIFTGDTEIAENEQVIREMFSASPIYIYISVVIFAPLIEELVFRGGFFYLFRNKYVFVLASGLAFGLVHVLGASSWHQFLFIIPYAIPGFAFALALYETRNLYVPIAMHFLHNGIVLALQTFVIFFGNGVIS